MAVFTTTSKNPVSWTAPTQDTTNYFLLIDDTYALLIDDTYKLKIQGRDLTDWTPVTRNPATY